MRCQRCGTTWWGMHTLFEIRAGRDVVGMVPRSLCATAVRLAAEGKVERRRGPGFGMGHYVVTKKGQAAMRCPCAKKERDQLRAPPALTTR